MQTINITMNYRKKFYKLGEVQLDRDNMNKLFINNPNKMQLAFKKVSLIIFNNFYLDYLKIINMLK